MRFLSSCLSFGLVFSALFRADLHADEIAAPEFESLTELGASFIDPNLEELTRAFERVQNSKTCSNCIKISKQKLVNANGVMDSKELALAASLIPSDSSEIEMSVVLNPASELSPLLDAFAKNIGAGFMNPDKWRQTDKRRVTNAIKKYFRQQPGAILYRIDYNIREMDEGDPVRRTYVDLLISNTATGEYLNVMGRQDWDKEFSESE